MKSNFVLLLCFLIVSSNAHSHSDFVIEPEFEKVTCGSAIKLQHLDSGYKLHSHQVTYGLATFFGSGQQSVTGFANADDTNGYFIVKGGRTPCVRGDVSKCGDLIRLLHMNTKKYLHSHNHLSPLSNNQEVSAYEGNDDGDLWKIICANKKEKDWKRENKIRLFHEVTGKYLSANIKHQYRNPIPGQLEVCAKTEATSSEIWAAAEGIYFPDRFHKNDQQFKFIFFEDLWQQSSADRIWKNQKMANEADWTPVEALVLSQAVYQHISKISRGRQEPISHASLLLSDWLCISQFLLSQSIFAKRKDEGSRSILCQPGNCKLKYEQLIFSYEEENSAQDHMDLPLHAKLVRFLHVARINQLKAFLKQDELDFSKLIAEIDEIRQGKWDRKLSELFQESLKSNSCIQKKVQKVVEVRGTKSNIDLNNQNLASESFTASEQPEAKLEVVDSTNLPNETTVNSTLLSKSSPQSPAQSIKGEDDENVPVESSDKKRKVEDVEDVIPENTPKKQHRRSGSIPNTTAWKKTALMIWNKIADHRYGNVFMNVIKETDAPGYRDGEITATSQLHRDLMIMFSNCLMFNAEDTDIYSMALSIRQFADQEMRNLVYFEGRKPSATPELESPVLAFGDMREKSSDDFAVTPTPTKRGGRRGRKPRG
ncbi:hypothetical protein HK096_005173, partial [Nowakowskiella sp. JEL0078]